MKRKNYILLVSFIILITLLFIVFFCKPEVTGPRTIGQVFTKVEADSLFGKVTEEKSINAKSLKLLATGCKDYMLANIIDSNIVVLNEKKELLSETLYDYTGSDTVNVFSISVLYELLSKGNDGTVMFQHRGRKFTVTNGEYVLEMVDPCPPICPDFISE